jgi:hypothetical protein
MLVKREHVRNLALGICCIIAAYLSVLTIGGLMVFGLQPSPPSWGTEEYGEIMREYPNDTKSVSAIDIYPPNNKDSRYWIVHWGQGPAMWKRKARPSEPCLPLKQDQSAKERLR